MLKKKKKPEPTIKRLVILDGNHLAYRAYYKFTNLKTIDGQNTALIYGMPYIVESLIRKLSPTKVVAVFDGGRSRYRKTILPDYKKREQKLGFDKEDFYKQRDIGKEIFMALGINVAYQRHQEADDIITMITRIFFGEDWEIIIVSGDKDFNQLIKYNVSVFNTSKNKLIHEFNIEEEIGCTARQFMDFLCITGDKSDNISGYPGIGEVRGKKLLKQFGSVSNFLDSSEKFGNVDKEKLEKIYIRNKQLIDLRYYYNRFMQGKPIPWINEDEAFDEERLRKLCSIYEIGTFMKPQFIHTFKNL